MSSIQQVRPIRRILTPANDHMVPAVMSSVFGDTPYLTEEREALPLFLFRRKRMDCHDRHDCNGNCNTYLPPSARLLHRSVLYRTFSRASWHRASLHLVLVEEQITPDSPIPILCRLRQSADRLALYTFFLWQGSGLFYLGGGEFFCL